ncbi:MAG: twin-arginine translocation signal domain-containing protein [Planctomycetes bacterium]|nr:twin-arginine translocation signal domain-containing protein [Planctomycetota bacterium]MCH8118886.1 twin-arginine translocation signal domain-containing protein [Planctomycetota bacterium]
MTQNITRSPLGDASRRSFLKRSAIGALGAASASRISRNGVIGLVAA